MPLAMRPTGLGSGIDKDRRDYTSTAEAGMSAALGPDRSRVSQRRRARLRPLGGKPICFLIGIGIRLITYPTKS
jgi:hypothetical protein